MSEDYINERFHHCEEKLNEHEGRIDKLEDTYATLQNLNYRMGKVENGVESINKKIDENSKEKGKKWDKLIDYLFYFIIASILGYLAIKLGIK